MSQATAPKDRSREAQGRLEQMEERLQWLQKQNLAYGLVLGSLVQVIWPDERDRAVARQVLGKIVGRMRAEGLGPAADRQVQGVLSELDGLFQMSGGSRAGAQ